MPASAGWTRPRPCDAFADELEDRFGPLPEAAGTLLVLARLGRMCRGLGVAKASAGPKAIALDFFDACAAERLSGAMVDLKRHDGRLVWSVAAEPEDPLDRLGELLGALAAAGDDPRTSQSTSS